MRLMISTFLFSAFFASSMAAAPKNSPSVLSWSDTQVDIATHVTDDYNFFRSVSIFRGWGQYLIDQDRYMKVEGDTTQDISGYDVVHILGDLNNTVLIEDQAEVVIRKGLGKDAIIYASGIQKVYIGGDFLGTIESTGSLHLIVKGDFKGILTTGAPSTVILVGQNFDGEIKPNNPSDGGLVSAHVMGESLLEHIVPICKHSYADVKITVGNIDTAKGIHTCGTKHRLVVKN